MIDPEYKEIHYHIGLAFFHLGEMNGEKEYFYRAAHHFRLATKEEEENDQVLLDWALALINIADHLQDSHERIEIYRDAEHKMTQSARMGNLTAYYHLACLYSLLEQNDRAFAFIKKADEYESLLPSKKFMRTSGSTASAPPGNSKNFLPASKNGKNPDHDFQRAPAPLTSIFNLPTCPCPCPINFRICLLSH